MLLLLSENNLSEKNLLTQQTLKFSDDNKIKRISIRKKKIKSMLTFVKIKFVLILNRFAKGKLEIIWSMF